MTDKASAWGDLFAQGGEMGRLLRDTDWSRTALGPPEQWPQSLRTMLGVVLGSRFPMLLWWGPQLLQLYNDAYRPILRDKHPASLVAPAAVVWSEVWDVAGPMAESVLAGGPATWTEDLQLYISSGGIAEETHFTFSYSPVPGDDGRIGGLLNTVQETSAKVQGERQIRLLHELAARAVQVQSEFEVHRMAAEVLASDPHDLPFVLLYRVEESAERAWLSACCGWPHAELELAALELGPGPEHPLASLLQQREALEIDVQACLRSGAVPLSPVGAPVQRALALPLLRVGQARPPGLLIAGLSPHRRLDPRYRDFFSAVADQLSHVSANALAFEAERRRALTLAELDRSKTQFFSQISHEFRTPLTLIMGQIEQLRAGGMAAAELDPLQRHALRLLNLVNNLLNFTRLEAGRLRLAYEPVDLGRFTLELAGSFRSLLDQAGLRLQLDCPRLSEPVYVDPGQWEKIVFNLLSNAYKFTWQGEIALSLRERDEQVELCVRDTGTGIPAAELPRLFERFHRVENAKGRSFEGSGIGLALVQELVRLHGGTITAQSELGVGSCFTVCLPRGCAHLAPEQISQSPSRLAPSIESLALLQESARWSAKPAGVPAAVAAVAAPAHEGRVLVVDDNADMRDYLERLLSPRWEVELAVDGQDALERAHQREPDLILSDVMMPRLDGFGLVRALREDPQTATIPIVLLSARAGEESTLEGLERGADDYLVKPFTALELQARVATHLQARRTRNRLLGELERVNAELEAFSYTVAHDLRAPLRSVLGFGQLLQEQAERLDDEGRDSLNRVLESARRMAQMIEDLLRLARVGKQSMGCQSVDLSALAGELLEDLARLEPQRRVRLQIQPGLQAWGDPGLLRLALMNLLGNAWKYSARRDPAQIAFGVEQRDGESLFWVRDNGAGFDMAHAGKLFGVFQRLHHQSEFAGTGVGLATVARIIGRHGGRIWAEAAPDAGSCFYFTLPAPAAAG